MPRAVETHVLDEVCEPALIFVFEHRTRIHDEPKLGAALGLLVRANVVAQPIRERANRNERIDGDNLG
jgi:hypothetical protein